MVSLGTIRGQMILDVQQALASYTAVRLAHLNTVTALATGGGALATAGAAFAGFGAIIAAGFGVAVNAASDFERELSFFSAVAGATEGQMEGVREEALRLGEDTIYSAGGIATSFVELAKAGVGAEDIIDGIGESVTNLGAAADIPLDTAAQIMLSAVQTFGLGTGDAIRVADLLAGAANASIIEVEDLGQSLKYAGGVASSLGIPIEQVIDALGLLGTYGIRGSTAGTSLRQMLVSLGGATGPATEELRRLGIISEDGSNAFFDQTGSAKSLSEIFQILQDATAGMTDEQRLASLRTIFQNRALASAIALTESGAEGFREMNEAVGQTTAMEVAEERLNNLSGDVEILTGNLETLAITVGGMFQEELRGLVQALTEAVQWFLNLDEETQRNIVQVILFIGALSLIMGGVMMVVGGILRLVNMFIRMRDAAAAVRKIFTVVRTAVMAIGAATLGTVGLIVGIIAIVVGVIVWLWNNVEGFRNFWIAVWDWIVEAAKAAADWFMNLPAWFSSVWDSISTGVTNAWNAVLEFFSSIPERITGFFSSIGQWFSNLWNTITTWATTTWNSFVTFVGSIPGRITAFFASLPERIGYIIGFMVGTITRWILQLGQWFVINIPIIINNVVNWFAQLPGRIAAFFIALYLRAVEIWNQLREWLITTVTNIINSVVNFFATLPGRVTQFFINLYNNVVNWLTNLAAQAAIYAANIYNGIVDWLVNLPANVAQFFTDMYNNVVDWLTQAWNKAVEMGENIYNGIIDAILGLPGMVTEVLGNVVSAFTDMVSNAFNAVKDFGNGLWEGFKAGLGISSPSYIEYAVWAITDTVAEETDKLTGQVRDLQSLGNRLNDIEARPTFDLAGSMSRAAADMANQIAEAKGFQNELASMAMGYESSQLAMSRLPNDAWETSYATAARSAQANREVTVTVPPMEVPEIIQLVDEDGSILASTRVQTRKVIKKDKRTSDLVGKVRI